MASQGLAGLRAALDTDGWSVVIWEQVVPEKSEWPWEALGLAALHGDAALIAARIINPHRVILGGPEMLGFGGLIGCPDYARPEGDHGFWCMATKTRSVSAPHPAFFIADSAFLAETLPTLPVSATFPMLGAWLGAAAMHAGRRAIFSAIVTGMTEAGYELPRATAVKETAQFIRRRKTGLPDYRFYSRHLGTEQGSAFQLCLTRVKRKNALNFQYPTVSLTAS